MTEINTDVPSVGMAIGAIVTIVGMVVSVALYGVGLDSDGSLWHWVTITGVALWMLSGIVSGVRDADIGWY